MALHPLRWFFANQFVHLATFLLPSARHDCVPGRLRERLERRLRTAMRLARWRIVLFVLIYSAILSAVLSFMLEAFSGLTSSGVVDDVGDIVLLVLGVVSPLSILALIALVPLNRTLMLLSADIHVLGMEIVSRNVEAEGVLPSDQALAKREPKSRVRHPRVSGED